jgi:hypothetical protein
MMGAVLSNVEVGFVDAGALKSRVVISEDISNFMGLCCVFLEIGAD